MGDSLEGDPLEGGPLGSLGPSPAMSDPLQGEPGPSPHSSP